MKIEQLRYVIEIAKVHSITKAAENLFTSQSNISLSIKQLEKEIGQKILTRSNNGTDLTPFGQEFYNKACGVVKLFDELHTMGENTQNDTESVITSYPFTLVNKTFSEFIAQNPTRPLLVKYREKSALSACIQDVAQQRSDIAFIGCVCEKEKKLKEHLNKLGLKFVPLIKEEVYAYTGKNNAFFAQRDQVSIEELKGFNRFMIGNEEDTLMDLLESSKMPQSTVILTESLHHLLELEKTVPGYSLGIGVRYKGMPPDPSIIRVKIHNAQFHLMWGYVLRKDDFLTENLEEFLILLKANMQ